MLTTRSGSHTMKKPIPSVRTTNAPHRETHSRPNQNVRICQRKCYSSHVPRASLRFT